MRQDACRSLDHQMLSAIPNWIAGHADPGSMAQLDRALSRWLANQPAERNQRVGYARKGVFTLAEAISEEEYAIRNRRSNRMRSARKLGLKVRNEEEYVVARAEYEEKRLAAIKAAREADITARVAALPAHLVEAFGPFEVTTKSTYTLKQAEWVATLPPEDQQQILDKRAHAKRIAANRK